MADSLSSWMVATVGRAVSVDGQQSITTGDAHDQQAIDDTAFIKGSKVQIIRFLGFGANGKRIDVGQDEDEDEILNAHVREQASDKSTPAAERSSPLWAIVGDKTSWVCARLSSECVQWFDNVHTRPLLSLRGSIISLRWFRPAISTTAAHLHAIEAEATHTGPFAAATTLADTSALLPRLYLDVRTIHLWGSINEAIFHETYDLQSQLLPADQEQHDDNDPHLGRMDPTARAVQRWFARMIRRAQRKAPRQARLKARRAVSTASDTVQTSTRNVIGGTSDESSSLHSSLHASQLSDAATIPPAFQQPALVKRSRPAAQDDVDLKRAKVSNEAKSDGRSDGWGEFEQAWADEEGFDLIAQGQELSQQVSDEDAGSPHAALPASDESNFILDVAQEGKKPSSSDPLAISSFDARDGHLEAWRMSDDVKPLTKHESAQSHSSLERSKESISSITVAEQASQSHSAAVDAERLSEQNDIASRTVKNERETTPKGQEEAKWSDLIELPEE